MQEFSAKTGILCHILVRQVYSCTTRQDSTTARRGLNCRDTPSSGPGTGWGRTHDQVVSLVRNKLRGAVKKKHSIFKDIAQIGGREVNPISKKNK